MSRMVEPVPPAHQNAASDAGETVAAPRPDVPDAADLAWSNEDDTGNVPPGDRQSWRATWRKAAALFAGGLGLAGVIVLVFWLMTPPDNGSQPAPPPRGGASATSSAAPTASSSAAAPPSIPSTPDQDNNYVQALNNKGISFANPDAAIYNGKLVCQDMSQGMSVPQIVAAFRGSNPSLGDHADTYVAISVHAYCPQNNSLVGNP